MTKLPQTQTTQTSTAKKAKNTNTQKGTKTMTKTQLNKMTKNELCQYIRDNKKHELNTVGIETTSKAKLVDFIYTELNDTKSTKNTKKITKVETMNTKIILDKNENINTVLNNIDENNAKIKELRKSNSELIKEAIKEINTDIKALESEHENYSKLTKINKAKILKSRYENKSHIVNTVLNLFVLGLNIDNTMTISSLNKIVTYVNKGLLSKTKVNKSDKATILLELRKINHNQNKLKYTK